jgi:hypothetical protein
MVQKYRSLRALAVALTAALALCGCPAPAPRPSYPGPQAPVPSLPAPPPGVPPAAVPAPRAPQPVRENHLSPATHALVAQAHGLAAHGDLDGASSTLDRALRIEPNNPLLWIELARLRLSENDAHQGEGCARKALALASGDRGTQARAGRVLADALRAQHRDQEASKVEKQPYMH